MTRWKLTIEYKGTHYAGWQKQKNASSVQQHIEEALTKFCGQVVNIHGAGRTDAGVHARGQVAHFDLDYGARALSGFNLAKALNAHMRHLDIAVINAVPVGQNFHARFSALNKFYRYRIVTRNARPVGESELAWHIRKHLDSDAMQAGAKHLVGSHDFTSFRDSECQARSAVKTLDRLSVIAKPYDAYGACEIIIEAEGKSFLHHQVRNMVGTLSLVGSGKWQPDDVKTARDARDRTKGGPTAPPEGLCLMRVDYGADVR